MKPEQQGFGGYLTGLILAQNWSELNFFPMGRKYPGWMKHHGLLSMPLILGYFSCFYLP
jgi:hypothetical protein